MMAPFVVGGGKGKAETFAKQSASINPEGSKLMLATIDAHEGNLSKAETAALAVKPGADEELQVRHGELLSAIGGRYSAEKKYADADRVLREGQKRYPDSNTPSYMAARLQQEQGKHREAVTALEQLVIKMPRPHVHYRIGKSFQALGEKAKAVAAYEKALAAKSGLPKSLRADAEEQLKTLRG